MISAFSCSLPAVVDRQGPLEYRAWRPGESLIDGVWNIPIPEKREVELGRLDADLLIRVGPYRRAITLPDTLVRREVAGAHLEKGLLEVTFT